MPDALKALCNRRRNCNVRNCGVEFGSYSHFKALKWVFVCLLGLLRVLFWVSELTCFSFLVGGIVMCRNQGASGRKTAANGRA